MKGGREGELVPPTLSLSSSSIRYELERELGTNLKTGLVEPDITDSDLFLWVHGLRSEHEGNEGERSAREVRRSSRREGGRAERVSGDSPSCKCHKIELTLLSFVRVLCFVGWTLEVEEEGWEES